MSKKSNLSALINTTKSQQASEKEKLENENFKIQLHDATRDILTPTSHKHQSKSINKVIRDTFSFPEKDYRLINHILNKSPSLKLRITKSEILRAGLHALSSMHEDELAETLKKLERIKSGRKKGYKNVPHGT